MIGESMDVPTQALALGYLSLAWGFGTILGELLHQFCWQFCSNGFAWAIFQQKH